MGEFWILKIINLAFLHSLKCLKDDYFWNLYYVDLHDLKCIHILEVFLIG